MAKMMRVKVAELSDLTEGGMYPVDVDGEPICLARVEGCLYAFTDNCTHISGPLNNGELEGTVVTCPLHRAQFDIATGKVLRGPARQELQTYAVEVRDQEVWIEFPEEGEFSPPRKSLA